MVLSLLKSLSHLITDRPKEKYRMSKLRDSARLARKNTCIKDIRSPGSNPKGRAVHHTASRTSTTLVHGLMSRISIKSLILRKIQFLKIFNLAMMNRR
jgi:hypothetical protein